MVSRNTVKTIGFVLFPERGGYYPTFKLAKALKSDGYRIVYFGTSDFVRDVEEQGLEYKIVLEDAFKDDAFDPTPLPKNISLVARLKHQISLVRYKNETLHKSLSGGSLIRTFENFGVDLLVIDALLSPIAIFSRAAGFKVVSLTTELVGVGHQFPPHTCSAIYNEGNKKSEIEKSFEWFKFKLTRKVTALLLGWIATIVRARSFDQRVTTQFEKLKSESGLKFVHCEYGVRPLIEPEYTLCPSQFDFLFSGPASRKYLGHCIDLDRTESHFDWSVIRDKTPLIYCSLGTHVAEYGAANRFFSALIKLASARPDYDFLASLGPGRDLSDFGDVPENLHGAKRLPQLEVLARSDAMITNGGLGTIKECIYFNVPMLVLPCNFDQPGNAARVVFHGIGRRDRIRQINAIKMTDHIDDLINNSAYKDAISKMSIVVRDDTEFEEAKRELISYLE
jgi:Glycosyl transferases, related to UDP-glucuronosyltransferase